MKKKSRHVEVHLIGTVIVDMEIESDKPVTELNEKQFTLAALKAGMDLIEDVDYKCVDKGQMVHE